jgi:TRAP-type C4-dicarboxylate transport system permease large subunit
VEGARGWTRPTAPRLAEATTETTEHIGALLALMALSVGFGGVVERSEVMNLLAGDLGGPWPAMALLTAMLVVVGMLMDPYGAVILVSATLAHVAAANGISALHFWMVVLVAFELGYLTPPVALNHLLTRAVVGDAADEGLAGPEAGLWLQHERYLLPVTVMGTALLIVAFGPLLLS